MYGSPYCIIKSIGKAGIINQDQSRIMNCPQCGAEMEQEGESMVCRRCGHVSEKNGMDDADKAHAEEDSEGNG
jgi:hypothetical protein